MGHPPCGVGCYVVGVLCCWCLYANTTHTQVVPVAVDEYTRLHQEVKQWVGYKSAYVKNLTFPSTIPEMKV